MGLMDGEAPQRGAGQRVSLWGLTLACAWLTTGCEDTDPTVFVDVDIRTASAVVEQGTLVSTVAGSLAIHLHLGPRASGAATVQLGALSLTNQEQTETFVSPLEVSASPAFPVVVDVDSDVDVTVVYAAEDNQLEVATYDEICAVGWLRISGAFDDSLRGTTALIASTPFAPSGCP